MSIRHVREGQVGHLVRERPVIRQIGDRSIFAHADEDKSTASGIGHAVTNARAVSSANPQREVRNREVTVVFRNRIGRGPYPGEKLLRRNLHLLIGQGDLNFAAANAQYAAWSGS